MARLWTTANHLRYLGFLAFAFLIWHVGPKNLLQALEGTNLFYLFAAFILNLPLIALKTRRWQGFLSRATILLPFSQAWRAYAASIFIGILTPGRIGEVIKAAYVTHNAQAEVRKVLPSVLIDRLFDFYFFLVLGLIGVFRYSMAVDLTRHFFFFLMTAVLFSLPFLIGATWLGNCLRRSHLIGKFKDTWREVLMEIHSQFADLTYKSLWHGFAFTVLAQLVFFFQCQVGAWGTGVRIPFVDLVLVMAISNFLTLLPVSISGIGVRDASLIVLLAQFGISQAQAMAFSLAILFIFCIGGITLGGICWILEPVQFGQVERTREEVRKAK